MSTILVTGGSGFLGSHTVLKLLSSGNKVRTTVRSPSRESDVRMMLKCSGVDPGDRLSVFTTDIENDQGWKGAISGCEYVLHVASPFSSCPPRSENEIIGPACEGAVRILKFCRDAKVKRVVMTSSFAAIAYGHRDQDHPFDESYWTNTDSKDVPAYHKSKTLAEKAAWDFMKNEGGSLELSVINPVGIFGPTLGEDLSSSVQIIRQILSGEMPGYPKLYFGAVDVRDVVDLHLMAMIHPLAKGERFIATACESTSLCEIADILKKKFHKEAAKIPTYEIPNLFIRIASIFKPEIRSTVPELGRIRRASSEKARRIFNWNPRSHQDAIISSAESLLRLGLIKTASGREFRALR